MCLELLNQGLKYVNQVMKVWVSLRQIILALSTKSDSELPGSKGTKGQYDEV